VARIIVRLPQRVPLGAVSVRERDGAIVVSLRGELDVVSAPVLQAYLSDIRWPEQARCVVDLTGLAFIDCACLGVLVRHCEEIRARGGNLRRSGSSLCAVLAAWLVAWRGREVRGGAVDEAAGDVGEPQVVAPGIVAQQSEGPVHVDAEALG
jgi:anti-sigma B factor antagonist